MNFKTIQNRNLHGTLQKDSYGKQFIFRMSSFPNEDNFQLGRLVIITNNGKWFVHLVFTMPLPSLKGIADKRFGEAEEKEHYTSQTCCICIQETRYQNLLRKLEKVI
jgi:hypothetical protein